MLLNKINGFSRSPELDDINWRFEYKYQLTIAQYLAVKLALYPHMYADEYTLTGNRNKYFVRSLYFDSVKFNAFHEKADGNSERLKLRIRTYDDEPLNVKILKVEIKVRKNVTTEKYVAAIGLSDYKYFMQYKHWPDSLSYNPVLEEFERYFHLKTQMPTVLVQYDREGFKSRNREELRITFDHHVSSGKSNQLYPECPIFREHHPGWIILEIKCNKMQSNWLHKLVKDHGLRIVSNSKYVQGMMLSFPSIVTPSWSA